MTLWFILDYKIGTLTAAELGSAGLLGVEMVKAGLARQNLAIFGKLQSFRK